MAQGSGQQLVRVRILKNSLPHIANRLPQDLRDAQYRVAVQVFAMAQQTVPVATGELRDSGTIYAHGSGYNVGYTARHAPWVHDGTVHMEARPWLQLAALEVAPQLKVEARYLRDLMLKAAAK